MRLKRIILMLVCSVMALGAMADDSEMTAAQKALRTEIKQFMSQEGYMPEIDEDGDIKFKFSGSPMFVQISTIDNSPLFVQIFQIMSIPENYSRAIVSLACIELSKYKGIKVTPYTSSVQFSAQMYLRDAEAFKKVFNKLVRQIDSASDDFGAELQNAQDEYPRL